MARERESEKKIIKEKNQRERPEYSLEMKASGTKYYTILIA